MDTGSLIRRRVLRGALGNYVAKLVAVGLGFLLTPYVLAHLGASTYGLWVLVGSVVTYGGLLDLGIGTALIKHVAEYEAKQQMDRAHAFVATALRLYAGLGVLVALVSAALATQFPAMFNIAADQRELTTRLVILMGIGAGIAIPATTTTAVLRGLQRYEVVSLLATLGSLLGAVATVGTLALGGGVLELVAASIVVLLFMQALNIACIRWLVPDLDFGWRGAERRLVRSILSYSGAIFVVDLGTRLQMKTDEIVIGALLPVSSVTPYALAHRLSELPQMLTDQFMRLLVPLASQLHAQEDVRRLRELYLSGTRLTLVLYVPLALTLVCLAPAILGAWVGASYAQYAALVGVLTLAGLIATSQWPAGSILQGVARHRPMAVVSLVSGMVNIGLSAGLAGPLGLLGIALGTLVPTVCDSLGFMLPYTLAVVGVRPGQLLRDAVLPAIAPGVPMVAVLLALERVIAPSSWLGIGVCAALALIVYAAAYAALGMGDVERHLAQQGLMRLQAAWLDARPPTPRRP